MARRTEELVVPASQLRDGDRILLVEGPNGARAISDHYEPRVLGTVVNLVMTPDVMVRVGMGDRDPGLRVRMRATERVKILRNVPSSTAVSS